MARESRLDDSLATSPCGHGASAGFDEEVIMPVRPHDADGPSHNPLDDETPQADPADEGSRLFDDDEGSRLFDDDEDGDAEEDEDDGWEEHTIPGSDETLRLPPFDSREWDWTVTTVESAIGEIETGGPMTIDVWESLCCCGDVWFVLHQGDNGAWVDVCGLFDDPSDGLAAVVEASWSFILDPHGHPLSLLDGDDVCDVEGLDDLSWQPDEDDDDTGDARDWAERLWATTITDLEADTVLAGPSASSVLPGDGYWYAIPIREADQHRVLRRTGGRQIHITHAGPVDDDTTDRIEYHDDGLLLTDLPVGTLARLAFAFGADIIWVLDHDSIRTITCDDPEIVATAVRAI
jgi:hypothetical protein